MKFDNPVAEAQRQGLVEVVAEGDADWDAETIIDSLAPYLWPNGGPFAVQGAEPGDPAESAVPRATAVAFTAPGAVVAPPRSL